MNCPVCSYESKVIETRSTGEGEKIRRRRECLDCGKRFTTYEMIETLPLIVIKKDQSHQYFDREKLFNSLLKACEKRSVELNELESLVSEIEAELQNNLENEVPSSLIGELVLEKLKDIDPVVYVRFASVYRQFKDVESFKDELDRFIGERS